MITETLKYISSLEAAQKFQVTEEEMSEAIADTHDNGVIYQRRMKDGSGEVIGYMQLVMHKGIFAELELLRLAFWDGQNKSK